MSKIIKSLIFIPGNIYTVTVFSMKNNLKQEAYGPQFAHLIKIATAYLQTPCNILPVLPQQIGHKSDHTVKRSKVILVSSFEQIW